MVVRYAVVGLGNIAQSAVLPAFKNAKTNSELVALVSGSPVKLDALSKKYKVMNTYSYAGYEDLLHSGMIDAVYICLPNNLHYQYAKRALEARIHVICEKPLSLSPVECKSLVEQSERFGKKLMTAYRLHFDPATEKAIELCKNGAIGEARYFSSNFSFPLVDPANIRAQHSTGGGPIWDLGVYCVNAARKFFGDEPLNAFAFKASSDKKIFFEVEEMASVMLKFPGERLASFTCSFGAFDNSDFKVVGTAGSLTLENAYDYTGHRKLVLKNDSGQTTFNFPKMDQFAPELLYFSDAILQDDKIEPSGEEALHDALVIEAIHHSAEMEESCPVTTPSMIKNKILPSLVPNNLSPELENVIPIEFFFPHAR